MAKSFLTNINLNGNELQNAVIQPLATAPASGKVGQIYMNSGDNLLYVYNGTSWIAVGAVLSVAGKTGVVVLTKDDVGLGNVDNTSDATKKTNFTGSVAQNNTGFVTGGAVFTELAKKLDLAGGTMTGAIAMGNNKITGLATPTADGDASTKKYVDDLISGLGAVLNFKGTVATTAALPLTGNKNGDVYIVTADNSEWVWTSDSSTGTLANYEMLGTTVDLSGYAPLASPAFTGTPTAPTAAAGTDSTQIATTEFVNDAVEANGLGIFLHGARISGSSTTAQITIPSDAVVINAYALRWDADVSSMVIVMTDIEIDYDQSKVTFRISEPTNNINTIDCVVTYTRSASFKNTWYS